jgi:hypothetical protein
LLLTLAYKPPSSQSLKSKYFELNKGNLLKYVSIIFNDSLLWATTIKLEYIFLTPSNSITRLLVNKLVFKKADICIAQKAWSIP